MAASSVASPNFVGGKKCVEPKCLTLGEQQYFFCLGRRYSKQTRSQVLRFGGKMHLYVGKTSRFY